MSYDTLTITTEGRVATLRMDNPPVNVITRELLIDLLKATELLETIEQVSAFMSVNAEHHMAAVRTQANTASSDLAASGEGLSTVLIITKCRQLTRLIICNQRIKQLVQPLTLNELVQLVERQVDAVITDTALRKVVGSYALGPIS